ncbi:hypothetical protein, partial [Labrenzia aggregata]|nr:hypothetical protein [Roseibium aggregatum]
MNEFVQIAQVSTQPGVVSDPAPADAGKALELSRPAAQSSLVLLRLPGQFVDFREIFSEDISFFRIGGDLQMLFADDSSIVVKNFFVGEAGEPAVIVGDDRFLSLDEFTAAATPQEVEEIQTAAGEVSNLATELGGAQGSGQNFHDPDIEALGGTTLRSVLIGSVETEDEEEDDDVDFVSPEEDTVPIIVAEAQTAALDEGNLPDGNEPNATLLVSTGGLGINFGENAGDNPTLTFNMAAGVPLDAEGMPLALSSDGEPLSYQKLTNGDGGQTLVAYKASTQEVVFTVLLDIVPNGFDGGASSAKYVVTLYGNLDNAGDAEDVLALSFSVRAADSDDDFVNQTFSVTIGDDTPELAANPDSGKVEEGAFFRLFSEEEPLENGPVAAGSLNIAWGADNGDGDDAASLAGERQGGQYVQDTPGGIGDRSVVFGSTEGAEDALSGEAEERYIPDFVTLGDGSETLSLSELSSGGVLLTYELSADGTVLTASAGESTVFVVSLSDEEDGGYLFDLQGVLDHPVDGPDDLLLTFEFIASDSDGDTVSSSFTVTVRDSGPTVADEGLSLTSDEDDIASVDALGTSPDGPATQPVAGEAFGETGD